MVLFYGGIAFPLKSSTGWSNEWCRFVHNYFDNTVIAYYCFQSDSWQFVVTCWFFACSISKAVLFAESVLRLPIRMQSLPQYKNQLYAKDGRDLAVFEVQ